MSRAPPFPTRRGRSSSFSRDSELSIPPVTAPGSTRPLLINRPPSRPTTPSNNYPYNAPSTAPIGPSRPQRSQLRSRVSEYSDDRASGSYRDSVATSRSDASSYYRSRNISSNTVTPTSSRPLTNRVQSQSSSRMDSSDATPAALGHVMSAFKSAGSRRRAMTNGSEEYEYQRERELEMQNEALRQKRIKEKVPGRKVNGKVRTGNIDAILDQIKDEWDFVSDADFNSVDLALQLLDESSSRGKDVDSFRRTKNMLSQALKGSVDRHYQAFASSLPHHGSLLNHLGNAQNQIDESRTFLQEAKDSLGSKRADLVQLWSRGQTLEEMMKLLDQIEHLKSVPDVLETLMTEKRLLQAAVLLVRSLKIINKSEMLDIGAVSDLRGYLEGQETALREILVDELHSHLYLKSFWCDSRWAAYTPNQRSLPRVEFENDVDARSSTYSTSPSTPSFRLQTRLERFLHDLSLRPNDPPHDLNDPNVQSSSRTLTTINVSSSSSSSPEADSFTYIETVLESLAVLGKLGTSLDLAAQRLPGEIFSLVETTLDEVSERAELGRRASVAFNAAMGRSEGVYVYTASDPSTSLARAVTSKGDFLSAARLRMAALEPSAKGPDHGILQDFFWTLYSKMDAVVQSLRVTYEIANRIGSRRDFKDSAGTRPGALFPLADIWASVQAEIKVLINDYLTDEEQGAMSGRNPISSINEVLREGRLANDRVKPVFRFSDTDAKLTNRQLRPHEDQLTRVLNDTMPGLAAGQGDASAQTTLFTIAADDRLLGVGQHHRLLVKPDAFHVTVLFQPTLSFLEKSSEILPSDIDAVKNSSSLLDEFVLKVYLPQLEEKVSLIFHQAVTGPEAFLSDPLSKQLSPEPLAKACIQLMALINSLCAMLQTTPFYRESYTRLILGVVVQFYQRCSDRFQDLVNIPANDSQYEAKVALSAQWAQRSEMNACLSELLATEEFDLLKQKQLCRQETNLELGFLGNDAVTNSNLLSSTRNLAALANLYRSVAWFADELQNLKGEPDENPLSPRNLEPTSALSVTTPLLPVVPVTEVNVHLPLSREMSLRFHALTKTYEQLSELILDTIRIEVRCRALFYLHTAMRLGNYSIEREAGEPDPHIVDLNNDLAEVNGIMLNGLPPKARQFVFVGIGHLMEEIMIASARHLRLPNTFGVKKIIRNILALQQSIKSITDDKQLTEFERAKQYYSLFFLSPQDMLDGIRVKQVFSFEEYQTMLGLQCGIDQTQRGDARHSKATDRNYSMYVIDLHGLEIENSAS